MKKLLMIMVYAVSVLGTACSNTSVDTHVLLEHAKIAIANQDFREAVHYLEAAIHTGTLDQERLAEAYKDLGRAYNETGHYPQALAALNQALQGKKDYRAAYVNRCWTYVGLNQPQRAIADCSEALRLDPTDAKAYHNRAVAYLQFTKPQQAVADLKEAVRWVPDSSSYLTSLCGAYTMAQQFGQAIASCDQALHLNPVEWKAYANRGSAYCATGQPDRADADFKRALDIKPGDADLLENRKRCASGKPGALSVVPK